MGFCRLFCCCFNRREEDSEDEECKENEEVSYSAPTKEDRERIARIHQERADKNRITPIKPVNPRNRMKRDTDYDEIISGWRS